MQSSVGFDDVRHCDVIFEPVMKKKSLEPRDLLECLFI